MFDLVRIAPVDSLYRKICTSWLSKCIFFIIQVVINVYLCSYKSHNLKYNIVFVISTILYYARKETLSYSDIIIHIDGAINL